MRGLSARVLGVAMSMRAIVACDDETTLVPRSDAGLWDVAPMDAPAEGRPRQPPPLPDAAVHVYCNGAEVLCDRKYDEIAFLGTHQSAASSRPPWTAPTQRRTLMDQLTMGGVRAFEFEVHDNGGVLALCVGACANGNASLGIALDDVKSFLDKNPNDVLTVIARSKVAASALEAAFDSAGLATSAHAQAHGAPWPTLAELIATGHRLVVFVDELDAPTADAGSKRDSDANTSDPDAAVEGGSPDSGHRTVDSSAGSSAGRPPWMHMFREWVWETLPSVGPDCVSSETSVGDRLVMLNDFELGAASDAGTVAAHDPDRVATRLLRCKRDRGRLPTFLFVDFAEVPDPNGGVQIANGLR